MKKTSPKELKAIQKAAQKASKKIDKDFVALCKKHNIERAGMITLTLSPSDKSKCFVASYSHIKKGKPAAEKKFAKAIGELFRESTLNTKNIEYIAALLRVMKFNRGEGSDILANEKALSKEDQIKLRDIRKKKSELVAEKNYEEASKLRLEERKLLGINEDIAASPAFDLKDLEPTFRDIEKVSKLIFKTIKNWKLTKDLSKPQKDFQRDPEALTIEAIKRVADNLKMSASEEQLSYILSHYPAAKEKSPDATWNSVVEHLLYQVVNPDALIEKLSDQLSDNKCRDCSKPLEKDNIYGQCTECYDKEQQ